MAAAGEIEADDLVKQTEGLWTKARDFDFLQQKFLLKNSREKANREAIDKLGRFKGIWLSKKTLQIGGGVLLALGGFAVVWAISNPIRPRKEELANPGFEQMVPHNDVRLPRDLNRAAEMRNKVEQMREKLRPFMTLDEFEKKWWPWFPEPAPQIDKSEDVTAQEALVEFKVQIGRDQASVQRHFPFEVPGVARPAYRVNLLWVLPEKADILKARLESYYFRSPD